MATIYVETTGNDVTGDGTTPATAYATIQKGVDVAVAGDLVKIGAGEFNEKVTAKTNATLANRITIEGTRGANGEWLTIIDPTEPADNFGLAWEPAPSVHADCWKKEFSAFEPLAVTCDDLVVDQILTSKMNDPAPDGGFVRLSNPIDHEDDSFGTLVKQWDVKKVLAGYDAGWLYIRYLDGRNPNTEDLKIYRSAAALPYNAAVVLNYNYHTLQDVWVRGALVGVALVQTSCLACIIQRCKISEISWVSVYQFSDSGDCEIRDCEISRLQWQGGLGVHFTDGPWIDGDGYDVGMKQRSYQYHKTFLPSPYALRLQDPGADFVVEDNTLVDNHLGLDLYRSTAVTGGSVQNNVIKRMTSVGIIFLQGMSGVEFAYNEIDQAASSIRFGGIGSNAGTPLAADISIHHNKIACQQEAGVGILTQVTDQGGPVGHVVIEDNRFSGMAIGLKLTSNLVGTGYVANWHFERNTFSARDFFDSDGSTAILSEANAVGTFASNWLGGVPPGVWPAVWAGGNTERFNKAYWAFSSQARDLDMATYVQGDGIGYATATPAVAMAAISGAMTVSAWFLSPNGGYEIGICRYDTSVDKRVWCLQRHNAGSKGVRVILSGDGLLSLEAKDYRVTDPLTPISTWTHMAFSWDAGTVKVYQDGAEVVTITKTQDDVFTTLFNTDVFLSLMAFGDGNTPSSSGWYDARVYNSVLSDVEIASVYSDPANTLLSTPELIGHWRLDDGAALRDTSGQGQHFTGVNNSGWTYPEGAPFRFNSGDIPVSYAAFVPGNLRSCWHDGAGNLKPSCTTDSYTSGDPTAVTELKPSIADHATGYLKQGLTFGGELKDSVKPPS